MDKVAFTGTFDPVTLGHIDVIERALSIADTVYMVVLVNPDKTPLYSVEERRKMLYLATKKYNDRVKIYSHNALAIDFCRENNLQYIVRGIRNSKDFRYEFEMAEWNKKFGGVYTIMLPANRFISATEVRKKVQNKEDISLLVPEEIINNL